MKKFETLKVTRLPKWHTGMKKMIVAMKMRRKMINPPLVRMKLMIDEIGGDEN